MVLLVACPARDAPDNHQIDVALLCDLIENGEHGPPADEVITKLADILDIDVAELFKLAGRDVGGASFEQQVLSELHRLRRDMRASFDRLDATVAALAKDT